ncbi:MAG TPA: response regulator [Roseimicrobium sp.]|nr:response regulator [Roseimicrobium sp.]
MNKPILLVEDDENDVFLLTKAMKRLGIANPVQIACDGQQAIDYMEGQGKFSDRQEFPVPYLVLLDLKLPRVKGLDVLKRIREVDGARPIVVILSSSRNATDVSEAYALGANAYLAKPADFDSLIKMVGSICDFWLTYNVVNPLNL